MNKVHIYYTTIKQPFDPPNLRAYFISRWVGVPFMEFALPSDIKVEKMKVASHLGLYTSQIEWRNRRGHKS